MFCGGNAAAVAAMNWIEWMMVWGRTRRRIQARCRFFENKGWMGMRQTALLYVMWYKAGYYGNHEGGNSWVVMCVCVCMCLCVCKFILYIYFQRRWVDLWVDFLGIFNFIVLKCEKIENFIKRMWQIIIMWCTSAVYIAQISNIDNIDNSKLKNFWC